jgi:hypothetical protein
MAQAFQIVSVDRTLTNWGHRHITTVATAPKPGFPDRWPVAAVVKSIAAGDLFYTVTGLGDPAFAHTQRCWCGFVTIRSTPNDDLQDGFETLPAHRPDSALAPAS